jgi:hypothetical protein
MTVRSDTPQPTALAQVLRHGRRAFDRQLELIFQCVCLDERKTDLSEIQDAVDSSLAEQARHAPDSCEKSAKPAYENRTTTRTLFL